LTRLVEAGVDRILNQAETRPEVPGVEAEIVLKFAISPAVNDKGVPNVVNPFSVPELVT
jgi:hypothetical protein